MTREQAVKILKPIRDTYVDYANISMTVEADNNADALEMAIEALEQPDIILCKDCKYYAIKYKLCKVNLYKPRNRYICSMPPNGFCNKAKRRTDA